MNQTSLGPKDGAQAPGSVPEAAAGTGAPGSKISPKYQAVLGPFTIRDLTVFGSTLLMFIGSLLPMFGGRYNLWNLDNLFFLALGIILPLVVTALSVARRLRPGSIVRIGSLSIDQFASVVASFAVTMFFLATAGAFTVYALVGLIGSLGLLAATVLAPHLPVLREDFKDRAEQPAHLVAREAAVPTRKPAAPKPAATKPEGRLDASAPGPSVPAPPTPVISAPGTRAPETRTPEAPAAAAPSSFGAPDAAISDSAPSGTNPPSPVETESAAAVPAPAAPAAGDAAVVPGEPAKPAAGEAVLPREAQAPTPAEPQYTPAVTMATPIVGGTDSGTATQHIGTVNQANTAQAKVYQPIGATVDPATRRDEAEHGSGYVAFWFAVAHPRVAVDEHTGVPIFTIEPGAWVLGLEDRGEEFLVQDADGKVGVLHDLSHIERG